MSTTIPHGDADRFAQTSEAAERTRVWDLPTRVFHWSLAASFAGAWLTGDSERFRDLHVMLGYTFAGLIGFRLAWGLIGSRYARFASFIFPPSRLASYLSSLLGRTPEHHLGHNPAGALAIFAMLALGMAISASGVAVYLEMGGEWLEELHEWSASAMLVVVLVHIAGVAVSSLLHRENLAAAMLTGWKSGRPADGIRSNHPVVGGILLAAVLGFWLAYQSGATDAWLPSSAAVSERGTGGGHDREREDHD